MRVEKARILVRRGTTKEWNNFKGFIPMFGEIIIYTDYTRSDNKNIPAMKIGDGKAYCIDLPFMTSGQVIEIMKQLNDHVLDDSIHLSIKDKTKWDNKVSCKISGERLILYTD